MKNTKRCLETPHGMIEFPAFFPVTTFDEKNPLDQLVRPYLKRMSPCLMVSYHYARHMKHRPDIPIFIDSGGFASLFEGSEIIERENYASIRTKDGEEITPMELLSFQEANADIGATLDFIISPGMELAECERRQALTIQNALFAKAHCKSESLTLYASLQCWDADSAKKAAERYVRAGFNAIAIGGLVPRAKDLEYMKSVVGAVRSAAPDCLLHVFGCGNPETIPLLKELGADSFDSSSYARKALDQRKEKNTRSLGLHVALYDALYNLYLTNAAVSDQITQIGNMIPNYAFIMKRMEKV